MNTSFILGGSIFRCHVSFMEGTAVTSVHGPIRHLRRRPNFAKHWREGHCCSRNGNCLYQPVSLGFLAAGLGYVLSFDAIKKGNTFLKSACFLYKHNNQQSTCIKPLVNFSM